MGLLKKLLTRQGRTWLGWHTLRSIQAMRCSSPKIFTKLADTVVQLRLEHVQVAAYLDDWLLWAASKTACLQASKKVVQLLGHLGFKINYRKSSLSQAQEFQWLGIQWNLQSHHLSIPPKKRSEIAGSVKRLLKSNRISRCQQ
ncbi:uncharacterized protein [Palaemon carinicauda]|uniref:uncharacterized protein n=1 Tax=Palaemon carinicauda TaxID=392227 RepID=UPI0035B59824